jgi:hypothetical protein
MAGIAEAAARFDGRAVAVEIPRIDWAWESKRLNAYLRGLFERIDLDPATFQPRDFAWTVPEWRS